MAKRKPPTSAETRAQAQAAVQRLASMDADSLIAMARTCSGKIYLETPSTYALDEAYTTLDRITTILGERAARARPASETPAKRQHLSHCPAHPHNAWCICEPPAGDEQ